MVRFIRVSVGDLYCSSHLLSEMQFARLNFLVFLTLFPDTCLKKIRQKEINAKTLLNSDLNAAFVDVISPIKHNF